MARFLHIERIEETTLAKNKPKGFHTFGSNPEPNQWKLALKRTEMADFIHTTNGNIGGNKCVVRNDTILCRRNTCW